MPGAFRLGTIAGVDIYINYSWLIILVLLTISAAIGWFPATNPGYSFGTYLLLGLIAAVLFLFSVLLHELAHSLVARARGLTVKSIVLYVFGGVSNIEQEPPSPGVEFQMAFVGPITNLLLGGLCLLLLLPIRGDRSGVEAVLAYLFVSNVLLGILNLVPGFPLDGGRVLHSIVWRVTDNANRATRITTTIGMVIAYIFIFIGIWLFFAGNALDGIWLGFIGWFLLNAAQAARTQATLETTFRGVSVEQVMNRDVTTVPSNISLQKLVDEYFLPQGLRSALVMQADQLAGLITLSDIRHVPREQWDSTPVGFAMVPLEKLHVVSPQQELRDVLPLMSSQDVNQLPVTQDGRLVGVLSRDAIIRSLQVRRSLGEGRRE
ncbi:MAG: site-2 protease family protein [Ktedonobacteraceae bacterium]|nr:site-2 protease family protein [Ktedonobacteraceae bacterium]